MKPLISLVSLLISCCSFAATKPNIIYIITDDLGYGDLSCYGQKHFSTPHIDRLAKEGIKFTTHYSGSTVCSPSRCSLMTGKDQGHAVIRGNGNHQLSKEDTTIAHILKQAGYTTGMIGKSCVTGNTQDAQAPFVSGFDSYYGTLSHVVAHHHYPQFVFDNGKKVEIEGNKGKSGPVYIHDRYAKKASEFIACNKDKPFFLLLSYNIPHADIDVPLDSATPFIGKFPNEKRYTGGHYKGSDHILANYAGMITRIDQHIGKMLDQLDRLELSDNTIVCFTSDNGPTTAGGYHYDLLDSNGLLRGGKRDLYEGGIRVPFLVRWPAKITPGRVSDHPSAFWDLMPTLCELTQQAAPPETQGISFLPTLLETKQSTHPYLYWEFHERGGRVCLRQGDWKIVGNKMKQKNSSTWQLFNLKDDPYETRDLANHYPEILHKLVKLSKSARSPSHVKQWNF